MRGKNNTNLGIQKLNQKENKNRYREYSNQGFQNLENERALD